MKVWSEFNSITREAVYHVDEAECRVKVDTFRDYDAINMFLKVVRQKGREEAASQVEARLTQFVREIKG